MRRRGLIATYNGEPINALYTSPAVGVLKMLRTFSTRLCLTCAGANVLRKVRRRFTSFTIKTTRETG